MSKTATMVQRAGLATNLLLFQLAFLVGGCSIRQAAVNMIGTALAEGGGVYTSDNDPELIREALPFGLKTFESLLAVSPEHRGLLLAAARGFTAYAYLLQDEADRLDATDLAEARRLRVRAHNLFLRGRDYALRGLALAHPGFVETVRTDRAIALAGTTRDDVPLLYWAGASWAGALTAAKGDLDLIAELPIAGALMRRVLVLDETYDLGAAHEFFVSYEGSRPGGDPTLAHAHYRRALELSGGKRASVYLALAESVVLRDQNIKEFRALVTAALTVDPDEVESLRLANTISRRRARWLQARVPDMFLDEDRKEENK
jgi:predicted anti-sigma-YlaC factor YlaD